MAYSRGTDGSGDPFLSILITSYNRSSLLNQCLSSIKQSLREIPNAIVIEIIVLNNGSTDDTGEVLRKFQQRMPLRLLSVKDNIGFIPGLLKCISSAKGEYCWFLGDDDFLTGMVRDLVDFLKAAQPDIVLLNHFLYTSEGNKINYLMKNRQDFLLKAARPFYDSYENYILDVKHNNAFFTHIAPIVFRKKQWDLFYSPEALQRYSQSHSIHTFILLSILRNSKKIGYFADRIVALGVGVPYPAWLKEEGRYDRFLMDVQYFTDMFREVFGDDRLVRHFRDVMLKKSVLVLLLGTKLRCRFSHHFYLKLLRLLYTNYKSHPFFWYGIIPVVLMPRIVFLIAYRFIFGKSMVKQEAGHTS